METTVPVIVGEPKLVNVAWFEKFVPEGVFAGTVPVIVIVPEAPAASEPAQVIVLVLLPEQTSVVVFAVTVAEVPRTPGTASVTVTTAAEPPVLLTAML